jgi:beta-aspartyl-dipeptidase (metallo-type)
MPIFDEHGKIMRLGVGDIQNLYLEWKGLAEAGLPLEEILKVVTSNPAKRAGIDQKKGSIEEGKDGDLLILNKDLEIETVIAKGQMMVDQKRILVKGTFEE